MKKLNLNEIKKHAIANSGECLSNLYINSHTPLLWQCEKGHIWKASFSNVKRGTWCDKCARQASANKRRGNIEEIKKIAKSHGGKCLSKIYKNSSTPLLFKCRNGHEWRTAPNNVKQGSWCKSCASKKASTKYSIDDAIQLAKKHNGKCLTTREEYQNSKNKITWQCEKGHMISDIHK